MKIRPFCFASHNTHKILVRPEVHSVFCIHDLSGEADHAPSRLLQGGPTWPRDRPQSGLEQSDIKMDEIALSSVLGASVYDATGVYAGQVREAAVSPREDPNRISDFVVKTTCPAYTPVAS